MTAARWIEHVTLTTGHTRRSPRGEVSPEAMAGADELIARIAAGAESLTVDRLMAIIEPAAAEVA